MSNTPHSEEYLCVPAPEPEASKPRLRAGFKGFIADILFWCLLCVLLAIGFSNMAAMERYSPVSLRYDTPISGKTAYAARQYSVEHAGEDAYWPTFWRETTVTFSSEFTEAAADCLMFSGDAALVWPGTYLTGAAPGAVDGSGCAVSSALAWKLWGGVDVAGKTVEADGETRVVRGVFEGDFELALLSFENEDTSQSWSAAELSGGPSGAARSEAESFASASGLGKPDSVLMGDGPMFLTALMAALPLIIMAAYGLTLIPKLFRKRRALFRGLVLFILLIILAAVLPVLLDGLPGWLIPTRWSDFSFWAELAGQAGDALREFLAVTPGLRDVECRFILLGQAGITLISACLALSICFRWGRRYAKREETWRT